MSEAAAFRLLQPLPALFAAGGRARRRYRVAESLSKLSAGAGFLSRGVSRAAHPGTWQESKGALGASVASVLGDVCPSHLWGPSAFLGAVNLQTPSQCGCRGRERGFQFTRRASENLLTRKRTRTSALPSLGAESGLVCGGRRRALSLWDSGAGT